MAEALGDPCKLWMGDLESYMDETFLRSAFKSFNFDLISVRWIRNHTTGETAKYCFVEFASALHAKAILENLNHQIIPGTNNLKRFKLNWASKPKDTISAEHDLYVGNLSPEVTNQELLEFFQKNYNSVRFARVVQDENGASCGYGLVKFCDLEERDRCIAEIDGMMFGSKPISVRPGSLPSQSTSSEGYQTAQMPAMYAYGGYMYGPTVSGYYDYSQPANYGQYSTATTSGYNTAGYEGSTLSAAGVGGGTTVTTLQSGVDEQRKEAGLHGQKPSTESLNAELFVAEQKFFEKMQATKWDFNIWGKELKAST